MTERPATARALAESPSVMISEHLQPFLPPASLASSSFEMPVSRCFLAPSVFLSSLLYGCGGMGGGGAVGVGCGVCGRGVWKGGVWRAVCGGRCVEGGGWRAVCGGRCVEGGVWKRRGWGPDGVECGGVQTCLF